MRERIFLTYTNATAIPYQGRVLGHHVVLNYIDSNGQLHTLQGMPEHKFEHNLEKRRAFVHEEYMSSGAENTDSEFGRLQGRTDANKDAPNGPSTLIAEGNDLSSRWERMKKFSEYVNSTGYEYRPLHQNSNSFAADALSSAGLLGPGTALPEIFDHQIAVDPATGQANSLSVPGFDRRLANPIGATGPTGFNERFGNWTPAVDTVTPRSDRPSSGARVGPMRYLDRRVISPSDTTVFDTGAPAVPFVPSAGAAPYSVQPDASPRSNNATQGNPRSIRVLSRMPAPGAIPSLPDNAGTAQQAGGPPGLVSGRPMPDYPVPPWLFGLPDRSAASGDDMDDWYARWLKPLIQQ